VRQRLRLSIRTKLILVIVGVSLAGIATLSMLAAFQEQQAARSALIDETRSLAHLVANRSEAALAFGDAALAEENARALADLPQIEATCIYDERGALFAWHRALASRWECPRSDALASALAIDADSIVLSRPIGADAQPLGSVLIRVSLQPLQRRLDAQLATHAATAAAVGLASLLLALWLQRLISVPLNEVRDVASHIIASGDYSARAPLRANDEIGQLADSFNRMLGKIDIQNRALTELNSSLEDNVRERTADLTNALDTLKRAQDELVRSEKMAALGSLVAGVAHELNTPIGNALVVASTIEHHTRELDAQMQANSLRRSQLEASLRAIGEASVLVARNLGKAHELVSSFKQVAVDQTSAKRRSFDLADVIDETLTTLRPGLKTTPFTIDNDVPPGIRMDSFPGAIGQIITNLVNNAVMHGFAGRDHGRVRIGADVGIAGGKRVRIRFSDDGVGMTDEVRRRAFDPFFTTRFGQGGSGLGLSLVFSITGSVLGGRIALDARPGDGTTLLLDLPLQAPDISVDEEQAA